MQSALEGKVENRLEQWGNESRKAEILRQEKETWWESKAQSRSEECLSWGMGGTASPRLRTKQ